MGELETAEHGGDLAEVARRFSVPASQLLDFSANLNPLGPPRSLRRALIRAAKDRANLLRYPDGAHAGLVAALARRHGVDAASIVVANGAAAVLDAALRVRAIRRCLVPEPAFSEDRRALSAARITIEPFALSAANDFACDTAALAQALRATGCDAVLVTNPHNPSGALATRAALLALADAARALGALAIVDEAFIDYAAQESIADAAARRTGLIVVRSLTKLFAAPALRVGYAVCDPLLAARLRDVLPSWPAGSIASAAFAAALKDRHFVRRSLRLVGRERERAHARLSALGLRVFPSAANFLLIELPRGWPGAAELSAALVRRRGIVVRDCSRYRGLESGRFVRVAIRRRRENARLLEALASEANLVRGRIDDITSVEIVDG